MQNNTKDGCLACSKRILSTLMLHKDTNIDAEISNRILLVEGKTDKAFIAKIAAEKVLCFSVGGIMSAEYALKEKVNSTPSSKDVIVALIQYLYMMPTMVGFAADARDWPIFGMVDNDFETDQAYLPYKKLFFIGTHDLETFLLSSDRNLLAKLPGHTITKEDIQRALFLADQYAHFKQAIYKLKAFPQSAMSDEDGTVRFDIFVQNGLITASDLLEYINSNAKESYSKDKLVKVERQMISAMKKQLDKEGRWKKPLNLADFESKEFWHRVNGHDILSALRYLVPELAKESASKPYKLDRSLEMLILQLYDYNCMKNTEIYQSLKAALLIDDDSPAFKK